MLREDLALIVPHNDREAEGERNACSLTLLFATTYLTKVVNHSQKWLGRRTQMLGVSQRSADIIMINVRNLKDKIHATLKLFNDK